MSSTQTLLERRVLDADTTRAVTEAMTSGTFATICAATRTRHHVTLLSVDRPDFRMLRPRRNDSLLTTGPAEELAAQVIDIPDALESLTGTGPSVDAPSIPDDGPPLGPGEILALADVERRGDDVRIQAACDELGVPEVPRWVSQLAWGAEGVVTLVLTVDGRPRFLSMLHLLPTGWGCLHADADDDLTFRPMSSLQVQARCSAFVGLLEECSDD